MPLWLSSLTIAYAELGQFDDARRCIGEAMRAMETTRKKWCEAEIHRIAGEIALKSPQPHAPKAQAYFERALAVARAQQAKSWELRAAMSMARLRRGHRDALMMLLTFRHGLRAAEISDLRWEQVDFKTATLHVRDRPRVVRRGRSATSS